MRFRGMAEVWGFENAAGHSERLGPDVCRHTHGRGPGHGSTNLRVCIHRNNSRWEESKLLTKCCRLLSCPRMMGTSPIRPRLAATQILETRSKTLGALGTSGARGTVKCRGQSSRFVRWHNILRRLVVIGSTTLGASTLQSVERPYP